MRKTKAVQDAHTRCRTFGHAWDEIPATARPLFGFYIWLRCVRCETIRKDTINALGELGTRSYDYPESYAESEKITRSDYRLRLISSRPKTRARKAS